MVRQGQSEVQLVVRGGAKAGQRAAASISLRQSAKVNGQVPHAYFSCVLECLPPRRASHVGKLLLASFDLVGILLCGCRQDASLPTYPRAATVACLPAGTYTDGTYFLAVCTPIEPLGCARGLPLSSLGLSKTERLGCLGTSMTATGSSISSSTMRPQTNYMLEKCHADRNI